MSEFHQGPPRKPGTIEKTRTGISGFDFIATGGLPRNRMTLCAGSAGSGKTVFGAQFLVEGILQFDEHGVFVTFEESATDIKQNLLSFGWDLNGLEEQGKWATVDASPQPLDEVVIAGDYDLGALLARIEFAIESVGAKRVVLDTVGALFNTFTDAKKMRRELLRIAHALRDMGVTTILTAERLSEYGEIARYGIEEFVVDNVILLRNILESEKRRRTIEILKFRGTLHHKGEYPFSIMPEEGIVVIPLSAMVLKQRSSDTRVTSGVEVLDNMCGGGLFRDSIILVSGATGTGKTLLTTHYISGGAQLGERCLLLAYEESREQLGRNASGWGIDFDKLEQAGQLMVVCEYPESAGLEDHLIKIKRLIAEFKPHRVAIDSLSALERVATVKGFREFVIGLTSYTKHQEVTGLFTSTTPTLTGGSSITEAHISSITDSIFLLRYVELYGEMRRGITVLKMRGSKHDKDIREVSIDEGGMHILKPFRNVTGILAGEPRQVTSSEMERLSGLFDEVDPLDESSSS